MENRQVLREIMVRVRVGNLTPVPADMSQDAVDKSYHVTRTERPCLLGRFIDGRRFRDAIHEKYLIKGDTKDVQDGRFNFPEGEADMLPDDPVKPEPPSKDPLNQVNGKSPIPFPLFGVFPECPPQVLLRKAGTMIENVERG
jgi:hypothetical protein